MSRAVIAAEKIRQQLEDVIHVLRRVATNGKRKPETQAALLRLADALAAVLAERGEGR